MTGPTPPHVLITGPDFPVAAAWGGRPPPVLTRIWAQDTREFKGIDITFIDGSRRIQKVELAQLVLGDMMGVTAAEALAGLQKIIEDTRVQHRLAVDQKLVVALGGSHTTMTFSIIASMNKNSDPDLDDAAIEAFSAAMRPSRTFIGRLYTILSDLPGLRIVWLSDTTDAFLPKTPPPSDLAALADKARRQIAALPSLDPNGPHRLLPSYPLLFVKDDEQTAWRMWRPPREAGTHLFSTSQALLEAMQNHNVRAGRQSCVLVNVLHDDLSLQNPLDPPVLTAPTLAKAATCGIDAVLMDQRVGIVLLPRAGEGATIPVYAV